MAVSACSSAAGWLPARWWVAARPVSAAISLVPFGSVAGQVERLPVALEGQFVLAEAVVDGGQGVQRLGELPRPAAAALAPGDGVAGQAERVGGLAGVAVHGGQGAEHGGLAAA